MNLRRLRWLAIVLPAAFLIVLEIARATYLESTFTLLTARLIAVGVIVAGVLAFSHVIFGLIARMEAEILQRNRHLTATNQILGTFTESWDLERVLPQALDLILDVIQVEFGMLCFLDEERGELVALASRGIPDELATKMAKMKLQDGLEADVIWSGIAEPIEDAQTDPRVMAQLKQLGVRSMVLVPLRSKGRVRGLAHIGSWQHRRFSAVEIQLLEATGTQIAMAMENSWLFAESRKQSERVRVLNEIGIDLAAELSLDALLEKIVGFSRTLVDARYGALAVLTRDGRVGRFITSGLAPELVARLGRPPKGRGLLGRLLREGKPLRISEIAADPSSVGFSPDHPKMISFLGVPIVSKGLVIGSLYLTDKERGDEFTQVDQDAVATLAAQAAVAIQNARMYEQLQHLAALEERERIAMDLHDGAIQSIYAIGLNLESCSDLGAEDPSELRRRLAKAVDGLNGVIGDIRSYIFDLRTSLEESTLRRVLEQAVDELKVNGVLEANLVAEELTDEPSAEQLLQLSQIAREAVTNAIKHARADSATIRVSVRNGWLNLSVADDGVGFSVGDLGASSGQGIPNMARRAKDMGGELFVRSEKGAGAEVEVTIPLATGRAGEE